MLRHGHVGTARPKRALLEAAQDPLQAGLSTVLAARAASAAVIESGLASGTWQLQLRKPAPRCPLPLLSPGPHPGLPSRSPSHTKNSEPTEPALGSPHSTLKAEANDTAFTNKRRLLSSVYL